MSKLTSVVADTWRGMVQRRLWPVAILLLAALVAVPLLLTADPEPVTPAPTSGADEAAALAAQPLVAVASASERESARRVLGARKNPFKPSNQPKKRDSASQSTEGVAKPPVAESPPAGGAQTGSGGSTYVPPAPSPGTVPEPSVKRPARPAGSLSVRWGRVGDEQLEKLEVERLDPLPTADDPLLVYLGLTEDGQSAVFMLDAGVAVDGDGRCRPKPEDCQSVELTAGETEFLEVVDEQGKATQFQLDLVKIHGRRAAPTRTLGKAAAVEARATRRALRTLGDVAPTYVFDARTGRLTRTDD